MNTVDTLDKRRARKQSEITYNPTVNFDGFVLPIQNRADWGSYLPALRTIHNQFNAMFSHHCKVLVLRTDFHVNPIHWSEGGFSGLIKRSKRLITKYYKLQRIGHIWAREASESGGHHYHLVFLLDGNKVNHPMVITNILTQEWKKMGHPHPRRNNHHFLTNSFDEKSTDAFHHCSYLAKIHTKDLQPKGARNFGASQIKMSTRNENRILKAS